MPHSRKKPIAFFSFLLAFVVLSFTITACLEEIEKLDKIGSSTLQPTIDIPLVASDFTMEEFFTEGESQARIVDQNGTLVLIYDDTLDTPIAENFFSLPDQQSPVFTIGGFSIPPFELNFEIPEQDFTFGFNPSQSDEGLDSILIKSGRLEISMNSNFPADIELYIKIQSLRTETDTLTANFQLSGVSSQQESFNLANAVLDLTNNKTTTNTITILMGGKISTHGDAVDNSHKLEVSFALNDLVFSGIFGALGTRQLSPVEGMMNVDVFNNIEKGGFQLLEPSIALNIRNSFGLPIGLDVGGINAIKSNGTKVSLTGDIAQQQVIDAPDQTEMGEFKETSITVDANNSNIADLISSLPRFLQYSLQAELNPGNSATKNFVLDTSRMEVALHVELPFYGSVNGLTLTKRFDFGGLGVEDIKEGKVKVKTVNGTPLQLNIQVYFVDASGTVLDSLFTDRSVLTGAPVGTDGFANGTSEKIVEVTASKAKFERIEQAEFLDIKAEVSTTGGGTVPVRFSGANKLHVALGVSATLEQKLN